MRGERRSRLSLTMYCCVVRPRPRCSLLVQRPGRNGGVTLLETLFASAIGALLIVALLGLYQRGVSQYAFAENRLTLNETLVTAERIFSNALLYRGGLPCESSGAYFNLVRTHAAEAWLKLFTAPVRVGPGTASNAVADSDEVTILKTGSPVLLEDHDPVAGTLTLSHAAEFKRGGLAVVCDDDTTVLLQITDDNGRTLGYGDDPDVRPGNCAAAFLSGGCGPENHRFGSGAVVAPYEPVVFFVARSGDRHALYRKRLIVSSAGGGRTAKLRAEEMLDGIALMRVHAGVEDSGARVRLMRGPPSSRPTRVLDIGLVAYAREPNTRLAADILPPQPIYLLGEPVGAVLANSTLDALFAAYEFSMAL